MILSSGLSTLMDKEVSRSAESGTQLVRVRPEKMAIFSPFPLELLLSLLWEVALRGSGKPSDENIFTDKYKSIFLLFIHVLETE